LLHGADSADVRVAARVGVGDVDVGQLTRRHRLEVNARSPLQLVHGLKNDRSSAEVGRLKITDT